MNENDTYKQPATCCKTPTSLRHLPDSFTESEVLAAHKQPWLDALVAMDMDASVAKLLLHDVDDEDQLKKKFESRWGKNNPQLQLLWKVGLVCTPRQLQLLCLPWFRFLFCSHGALFLARTNARTHTHRIIFLYFCARQTHR